jgi:AraC-like DNA-binding protein
MKRAVLIMTVRLLLERLAASAAMSRSVFAQRFRELTGDTPMSYLAG